MSGSMAVKVMGVHVEEMEDTLIQRVVPHIEEMDPAQCDEMIAYCDRIHQSEAMLRQMVTGQRDGKKERSKNT